MADFLKSLTGGIARFALAWMLPVSVAVGLSWAILIPALADRGWLPGLTGAGSGGSGRDLLTAIGIAAFATFAVSILLAYSARFIYRILEGYHLPAGVRRAMTRRQQRRHARLWAIVKRLERVPRGTSTTTYGLALEQTGLYPDDPARILPTRLGNALRALESYGSTRYGFDSQQFWFEILGTAEGAVRQEQEEMRAQVDLFVAAVAVFSLLSMSALLVGLFTQSAPPFVLAAVTVAFVPVAYRGAIRNMKDWQNAVRAMVNLGRIRVAEGMGLVVPWRLEDEQAMWDHTAAVQHYGDMGHRPWLDVFRRGTPYADDDGVLRDVPEKPGS